MAGQGNGNVNYGPGPRNDANNANNAGLNPVLAPPDALLQTPAGNLKFREFRQLQNSPGLSRRVGGVGNGNGAANYYNVYDQGMFQKSESTEYLTARRD